MREILFRGKRKCDGNWVEGDLSYHVHDGDVYVFPEYGSDSPDRYEIDPETVCQYTGLTDKNGRKIFEGDIVKHFNNLEDNEKYVIGCIKWDQDSCKFVSEHEDGVQYSIIGKCIYEVIGNIFDNPDMERESRMREILFRGKRVDNGEWIRGDLIATPFIRNTTQQNIIFILDITKADYDCFEDLVEDNGIFEVAPKTVCQYTGLTDKNGRKIFEGDILSFSQKGQNTNGVVKMEDGCFFAIIEGQKCWLSEGIKRYKGKIIGNIFDNSELIGMEGEKEC